MQLQSEAMPMQQDEAYPAASGGGDEKARQPGLQIEQPSMHVSWTHLFASNGQLRALGSANLLQRFVHPQPNALGMPSKNAFATNYCSWTFNCRG